jgi:hypothetical protein
VDLNEEAWMPTGGSIRRIRSALPLGKEESG